MSDFIVYYQGFYIVEADSEEEAMKTDRDDDEVIYDEWGNISAVVKDNTFREG